MAKIRPNCKKRQFVPNSLIGQLINDLETLKNLREDYLVCQKEALLIGVSFSTW